MRKLLLIAILTVLHINGFSQVRPVVKIDTTQQSVEYWQKWMADLNEMGVEKKNDSFYVKEEVLKLLKDSGYRNSVYPTTYTWAATVGLLNKMELKKAFWHMLNLYQTDTVNRNMVVGTFILYDSLMDMDKIILNTFYTYAFTDPQSCRINNNKPDIFRPDILEQKLRITKEIVGYIWSNRKTKAEKKS